MANGTAQLNKKGDKGVKNSEIYSLYEVLFKISHSEEIKLPVKVGFICLKNCNLLEPYYKAITDSRTRIIQQYVEPDEEGNLRVPEDKISEANQKLQEVLDMEENLELQKINLNDIQNESLPMDILTGLMPIIIEEEN